MSDKVDYVKSHLALDLCRNRSHASPPLSARRVRFLVGFAIFAGLAAAPSRGEQLCVGDANGDGSIAIGEIINAVGNALNGCGEDAEVCNGDGNCDGVVRVHELIQSVGYALDGCPVSGVVSAAWLLDAIERNDVQVIDSRGGDGHIPGALPLRPSELAATVDGINSQIIDAASAEAVLSAIGLNPMSIAVVYGAAPEFDPTRVAWALRYFGHADVRFLDGGLPAWIAAGGEIADGPALAAAPTEYLIDSVVADLRVTGAWLLEQLGDAPYDNPSVQIVDARSPGEFAQGSIPSAVHRQWTINLADGLYRPRRELEELYADLDKTRTTVVYCLAGWRASFAWLTLTGLGFEDVRVYDGSWLEWGNGEFPVSAPALFDTLFDVVSRPDGLIGASLE